MPLPIAVAVGVMGLGIGLLLMGIACHIAKQYLDDRNEQR